MSLATGIDAPNWGRIPALTVSSAATLADDGSVRVPTSAGELSVTLHDFGARLRLGPEGRDYGILVEAPTPLPVAVEVEEGSTRIGAGELVLTLTHAPLAFVLEQAGRRVQSSPTDAHFVRRHRLPPFARLDQVPGPLWLEAIGCHLPDAFVAARQTEPVWVYVE